MAKPKGIVVRLPVRQRKKKEKRKVASVEEVTRLGKALRMLGGMGGSAVGGLVGMPGAGSSIGTDLGATISRWLGSGDYSVSMNSITDKVSASGTIPSMHKDGQTIVVRHKEFLTEVVGSTTYAVQQQFPLNPGLSSTFPWLAGIADQYSEYRIRGMVFHYVPTSGMVTAATPALGSVMLQTSYRASEAPPVSKVELLNEYWASEGVPHSAFCHPIECNPKENPFNVQYIRTGAVPSGDSILMYDLGKTTLAVSGQSATGVVLGDLWVTYEIELRKPILTNVINANISTYSGSGTGASVGTALGTLFTTRNNSFQAIPVIGPNTITFPQFSTGAYVIMLSYDGVTNAAAWSAPTISGTGSSILTTMGAVAGKRTAYTVGTQDPCLIVAINITQPTTSTVVTLSLTTYTGSGVTQLLITEVNPASV